MVKSRSSVSDPFAHALRILGHRDHSEAELRSKLERSGFAAAMIDEAIERCYNYNYLDDRRYALARSREMLRNGRGVGPKILLDLQRHGVKATLAREALQSAGEEFPAEEVFHRQIERRFSNFEYTSASVNERRRVVSYFQRRGFDLGTIFTLLNNEKK